MELDDPAVPIHEGLMEGPAILVEYLGRVPCEDRRVITFASSNLSSRGIQPACEQRRGWRPRDDIQGRLDEKMLEAAPENIGNYSKSRN